MKPVFEGDIGWEDLETARHYMNEDGKRKAREAGYQKWEASRDIEDRDTDVVLWFGMFMRRIDAVRLAYDLGPPQLIKEALECDDQWDAFPPTSYEEARHEMRYWINYGGVGDVADLFDTMTALPEEPAQAEAA